jgi:hypothetical protein
MTRQWSRMAVFDPSMAAFGRLSRYGFLIYQRLADDVVQNYNSAALFRIRPRFRV